MADKVTKIDLILNDLKKEEINPNSFEISYFGIKRRIDGYLMRKRVYSLLFFTFIFTVLFNILFLKDFIAWTNLSRVLGMFFVYLLARWGELFSSLGIKFLNGVFNLISLRGVLLSIPLLLAIMLLMKMTYRRIKGSK